MTDDELAVVNKLQDAHNKQIKAFSDELKELVSRALLNGVVLTVQVVHPNGPLQRAELLIEARPMRGYY